MSCAVMRTWLPAFVTLPSRTAPTLSFVPMVRTSSFLPLKANDEVRAATYNPETLDSVVIRSSVMPSLKYSFSLSELMLTNGSTATDFFADDDTDAEFGARGWEVVHHTNAAIAIPTAVITPPRVR